VLLPVIAAVAGGTLGFANPLRVCIVSSHRPVANTGLRTTLLYEVFRLAYLPLLAM